VGGRVGGVVLHLEIRIARPAATACAFALIGRGGRGIDSPPPPQHRRRLDEKSPLASRALFLALLRPCRPVQLRLFHILIHARPAIKPTPPPCPRQSRTRPVSPLSPKELDKNRLQCRCTRANDSDRQLRARPQPDFIPDPREIIALPEIQIDKVHPHQGRHARARANAEETPDRNLLTPGEVHVPEEHCREDCDEEVEGRDGRGGHDVCAFVEAVVGVCGGPDGGSAEPEGGDGRAGEDEGDVEDDPVGDCEGDGGPDDPDEFAVDGAVGEAEVEEEDGEADEGGVPELEARGVSYRLLR